MRSIIIALVGEMGAGKETFKDALWDILHENHLHQSKAVLRFSDILFETLKNWNILTSRPNLQKLSQVMNKTYGKGTLTKAVQKRIEEDQNQIKLIDGVRWLTDAKMIRLLPRSVFIYVTADQKIRYERAKARRTNAKAGEAEMSWKKFQKLDKAKTEIDIPKIGAKADAKIVNNGTVEKYQTQVKVCFDKLILPLLHGEAEQQLP